MSKGEFETSKEHWEKSYALLQRAVNGFYGELLQNISTSFLLLLIFLFLFCIYVYCLLSF